MTKLLLCFLVLVATCCFLLSDFAASTPVYYYSPSTYWGNGAFRTYVAQDSEVPVAFGTEWSASFLHDLPNIAQMMQMMTDEMKGVSDESMEMSIDILLPDEAPVYTPFQSAESSLSPGHVAPYDKVHMDFHFYFQSKAQRVANITTGMCGGESVSQDTWCRGTMPYPPACCPPAYGNIGAIVPGMGGHLVDLLSPELLNVTDPRYHPFTAQFTFGTFSGRLSFYEVMITIDTFQGIVNGTVPKTCNPIRLPSEFSTPGYYPSMYCYYLTPSGNIRIELNTFKHYSTAGCQGPVDPTTTCSLLPGVAPTTKSFKKHCKCNY